MSDLEQMVKKAEAREITIKEEIKKAVDELCCSVDKVFAATDKRQFNENELIAVLVAVKYNLTFLNNEILSRIPFRESEVENENI